MIKGRKLHGMAVFKNGMILGRVSDVIADPYTGKLHGFVINPTGNLGRDRFLPISGLQKITKNGLVVSESIKLTKIPPNCSRWMQIGWQNSSVYDLIGNEIGVLSDYCLEDGKIYGFEISKGVYQDISKGRTFLSWEDLLQQNSVFGTEG